MDRLLTSKEVMKLLCIKSPTTLIKMENKGEIKIHTRVGNQKRYSRKHVDKLIGA